MLDTRPPTFTSNSVESSFKHYVDDGAAAPEVINVTGGGGTILPPDQVIDVSRANSMATGLNNGGLHHTTGRSTMSRSQGGTLKRSSVDGATYKPGLDTLRRVHFEKTNSTPESSLATPKSPSTLSSNATNTTATHMHLGKEQQLALPVQPPKIPESAAIVTSTSSTLTRVTAEAAAAVAENSALSPAAKRNSRVLSDSDE